jgi:hypothetical protein
MSRYPTLLVVCALCAACAACADPARQRAIDALGDEDPDVAPGPLHRAGQPCLVCHARGGVARVMSAAGTVYRDAERTSPLAGADVTLTDSASRSVTVRSNCAGNFFAYESAFAPTFPVFARVSWRGRSVDMQSLIHRDGDCARCHADPQSPRAVGHLYLEFSAARAADIPVAHCTKEAP